MSSSDGIDRIIGRPDKCKLGWPDHDTDREWREDRKWYSTGWANDPSWSQSKRAKPTHTDPEGDRCVDPALPSGSTSKTWSPTQDQGFWTELILLTQGPQRVRRKVCQAMLVTPLRQHNWPEIGIHWRDLSAERRGIEDTSR